MEINKIESTSLESITRGETDVAINTAKKFPRSVSKFRQDAMSMATADIDVAASCFYKLTRGGKSIEGPSVRLAEIVASAWGNMKFGARIVEEGERFVVAQGIAHDLEKNVYTTIEVRRKITDKNGYRYSDDMIVVTQNAACAIALRNAIFKTIPFSYAKIILDQAKRVAIGDAKTIGSRRQLMIDQFSKMGVTEEMLLNFVGKTSTEDIGLHEIESLIGVFTAIRDGDTTIDEQFPEMEVDRDPAKIEEAKKMKKLRASLIKALQLCESDKEIDAAVVAFEAENGKPIWQSSTHLKDGEIFETLVLAHRQRAANNKASIMKEIENAKNQKHLEELLERMGRHEGLDTPENEELITAVGKGLGIESYFDKE